MARGRFIFDEKTDDPIFHFFYHYAAENRIRDTPDRLERIDAGVAPIPGTRTHDKQYKGNGFYSFMFHRMVKDHPFVTSIPADLSFDNLERLNELIKAGYSPIEAFRGIAAFRVRLENGFD